MRLVPRQSSVKGTSQRPGGSRIALIFGISGQDGSYLAAHLLDLGFVVHGTARDKELSSFSGLKALGILHTVSLHSCALDDFRSVVTVVSNVRPDYIYNLAAQSSVALSFERPVETVDSIVHGTINILESIRFLSLKSRFYNAGSSECFGNTVDRPADEATPFVPRSPYAVGKAAAFWSVANYREAYGLYACTGILFNHESPIRPSRYVTQKVVRGAVDIAEKRTDVLELGPLDICRDWGWAPEYVVAMQRMLNCDDPTDFVIATGQTYSLQQFVDAAFAAVGLRALDHVRTNPALKRPTDIAYSSGRPDKAKQTLGWSATIAMPRVVELLMEAELKRRKLAH
jgi:GDPmannose 4,6-dehydratase